MEENYAKALDVAVRVMHIACSLCQRVQEKLISSSDGYISFVIFEENECWNWGRSNKEARLDVLEWGDSNGSEIDQSEEEAEEAVEEGGGEDDTPSNELLGENSQTSESSPSSLGGRNRRAPF